MRNEVKLNEEQAQKLWDSLFNGITINITKADTRPFKKDIFISVRTDGSKHYQEDAEKLFVIIYAFIPNLTYETLKDLMNRKNIPREEFEELLKKAGINRREVE